MDDILRSGAFVRALLIFFVSVMAYASTEETARKVLSSRCWACHAQTSQTGLRLDSREGLLRGGRSGAAISPGNPEQSLLVKAVMRNVDGVKAMPPAAALSADEIQSLREWIKEGAPWSDAGEHWSFGTLRPVKTSDSVDAIIAAALNSKGLTANPRADKRTLIRRLYFDLTGMPPTASDFAAAFNDNLPNWYASLVSTLLASPHFGEKWGRHWLDIARYGEDDFTGTESFRMRMRGGIATGWSGDQRRTCPYDRFLMAQLAGDLME